MAFDFIAESGIVQSMKSRMGEGFRCERLFLYFVEPSRDYPIGWDNGFQGGFLTIGLDHYTIFGIHIPWDSENPDEYVWFSRYRDNFIKGIG
jgi:hypothetical protein